VPVFGCLEQEGCANVVRFSDQFNSSSLPALEQGKVLSAAGLTEDGYWVNHGTSFLMAVEFTRDGPRARALLTYGQSSDPSSPFYRDQLQLFAQRKLRPVRFTEQEIAASPALEEVCVRMRDGAVYVGCD
jgi:acyl-homoserine-lactone acylase